jgi:hypothetical protein
MEIEREIKMKVGDLVTNKLTGNVGVVLEVWGERWHNAGYTTIGNTVYALPSDDLGYAKLTNGEKADMLYLEVIKT